MPKLSQYEIDREQNIERNKAILAGLDLPKIPPKETCQPKKPAARKKRKVEDDENNDVSAGSPPKFARTTISDEPSSGARRSARNAGKKVDYKAERIRSVPVPISTRNKPGNSGPLGSGASGHKMYACIFHRRRHISNKDCRVKFGSIPGIEVGTWWQTRYETVSHRIFSMY
jgi:E3 ubiquitin-protein ligase UHRF1